MIATCPVCKGPMKPLFVGSFCPNDCDRKPAIMDDGTPKVGLIREFSLKDGSRWRGTMVKEIKDERSWELAEYLSDDSSSDMNIWRWLRKTDEFVRDRTGWNSRGTPGWVDARTRVATTDGFWFLHFERIS